MIIITKSTDQAAASGSLAVTVVPGEALGRLQAEDFDAGADGVRGAGDVVNHDEQEIEIPRSAKKIGHAITNSGKEIAIGLYDGS